jgi:ribosomal protein S18 acetylase RimI-like enzyme
VRIVLASDIEVARRVLEIQRASYQVEADLVGYDAIPVLHETLDELQAQPLIFLGVSSNHVLAGLLGYRRDGDLVDIDRLAIDPAFFRRGLATKLMRELLVREREARRFTVSTGFGNAPALALYARFGFAVIGTDEPAPGVRTVQLARDAQAAR